MKRQKVYKKCSLCRKADSKLIFIKNNFHLLKCNICNFVYVGDVISQKSLNKLYSFESNYHSVYKSDANYQDELDMASKMVQLVSNYKKGGRILDIGCGVGFFLKQARANDWKTFGIELSSDTSAIARDRYKLNVLTGTLKRTTYPPQFFDAITLWDVIEHVSDPLELIMIVRSILKNNGIVAISTPNIDGLFPRFSYLLAHLFTNNWEHPEPPFHLSQFSKTTIKKLLESADFNIIKIYNQKIPINYSFREQLSLVYSPLHSLLHSPKKFIYTVIYLFISVPLAFLGDWLHLGDSMIVIASKKSG